MDVTVTSPAGARAHLCRDPARPLVAVNLRVATGSHHVPFRAVLEGRRTHRAFTGAEVPLDDFSDLLHYSFAPLRFADAGEMGVLQLRAAASGGARHETEAFVSVFRVTGVEPGLYHYAPIRHGLSPLEGPAGPETLDHLTHDQGFFARAGFGVLTVAVAERMAWTCPHPVAYKMLLHNVGHVAQVFSMTRGAGPACGDDRAIRNSEADTLLRLDHAASSTTFALACGVPELGPDGMPVDVRGHGRAEPRARDAVSVRSRRIRPDHCCRPSRRAARRARRRRARGDRGVLPRGRTSGPGAPTGSGDRRRRAVPLAGRARDRRRRASRGPCWPTCTRREDVVETAPRTCSVGSKGAGPTGGSGGPRAISAGRPGPGCAGTRKQATRTTAEPDRAKPGTDR
jgi:SagB-type dehydrogenase family enzyme